MTRCIAPVTLVVLALLTAGSAGCSGGPGPRSAADADRCDDPSVLAAMDVYPTGSAPARPFRTVGAVEARFDVSASGRIRTLRTRACEHGADAVIGWSELGVGGGMSSGFVQGNAIWMSGGGGQVVASGIAIVYTDRPDQTSAAAPLLARAADGGPPIVVDARTTR